MKLDIPVALFEAMTTKQQLRYVSDRDRQEKQEQARRPFALLNEQVSLIDAEILAADGLGMDKKAQKANGLMFQLSQVLSDVARYRAMTDALDLRLRETKTRLLTELLGIDLSVVTPVKEEKHVVPE
jgi:hypothetical protein